MLNGGNDTIEAAWTSDTAAFSGAQAGYDIARQSQRIVVTDIASGDTDILRGVEFLAFTDGIVSTDPFV